MKHTLYRLLPSWSNSLHAKRRKGWRRCAEVEHPLQFGQQLQDLVLFENILKGQKNGVFWEWGAGDGVVGLHSLALEIRHGWAGVLIEQTPRPLPWKMMRERRTATCLEGTPESILKTTGSLPEKLARPDLLACHSAPWNEAAVSAILAEKLSPRVLILQLPKAEAAWVRRLQPRYRLAFAYHDDEYYVARRS